MTLKPFENRKFYSIHIKRFIVFQLSPLFKNCHKIAYIFSSKSLPRKPLSKTTNWTPAPESVPSVSSAVVSSNSLESSYVCPSSWHAFAIVAFLVSYSKTPTKKTFEAITVSFRYPKTLLIHSRSTNATCTHINIYIHTYFYEFESMIYT